MTKTYLTATLQKSYYKKAVVFSDNDFIVLRSYNTDVVAIDKAANKIIRLWNGWSRTTSNHINDFLTQYGFARISKKEWLAMECVNPEPTYNIYISTGFTTHKSNIQLTEAEAAVEVDRLEKQNNNSYFSRHYWYE